MISETYRTDGHLDWLSVTLAADVKVEKVAPTLNRRSDYDYVGKGQHGYAERWTNRLGVQILRGGRKDMGTHVVFTATALENYRAMGITDKAVCQYIGRLGARASRVDLAIDIWDGILDVNSVYTAYVTGHLKTPAHDATRIHHAKDKGETVYIGNRKSDRMLRVYNKGVEAGTGENWLRLELELKRIRARAILNDLQDSDLVTRHVVNAAIGQFAQWNSTRWKRVITDENLDILTKPEKKLSKTYRWLMNQVAPALARYHFQNPQDDTLDNFMSCVAIELAELERKQNS